MIFLYKSSFSSNLVRISSLIYRAVSTKEVKVAEYRYGTDEVTNVTPRILGKVGRGLHCRGDHPLGIVAARIKAFFCANFRKRTGNPIYSFYDNLNPVVNIKQNFDDLLIPEDHVSRSISDTYYINKDTVLRSHTSAHEADLIRSGLDAFLIVGDVFRRDEIDQTHYPVFHQVEGVRLFTKYELFNKEASLDPVNESFLINIPSQRLQPHQRPNDRQERHHEQISKILENKLKGLLESLALYLFGKEINFRWVSAYFPWTHPSFELEIEVSPGNWVEMLGCGVIEQDMLDKCGAADRVGIAFGLGLERWAMKLFSIPDIRLFWCSDPGFLHQFRTNNIHKPITYKSVSVYPPCIHDISFWLPCEEDRSFHSNDFYELVGSIAGDLVERVELIDSFKDSVRSKESHCYRVVYRHMSKNLTSNEVNIIHSKLSDAVRDTLGCTLR